MRSLIPIVLSAGILLAVAGCAAPAAPPSASPTAATVVSASENADVGVCHSVSVALTILEAVQLGYDDGTLDRPSFDYMVKAITKDFTLLKIMHHDATLKSAAADLGAAIGDLATAGSEPDFGDTSELTQKRTVLVNACDAVGAPLSVVP